MVPWLYHTLYAAKVVHSSVVSSFTCIDVETRAYNKATFLFGPVSTVFALLEAVFCTI